MMDEDDFDDLLGEMDMLPNASQESLTNGAGHLALCESDEEPFGMERDSPSSDPGSGKQDVVDRLSAEVLQETEPPTDREHQHSIVPHNQPCSLPVGSEARIDQIEAIFEDIVDSLLAQKDQLCVVLSTRPRKPVPSGPKIDTASGDVNMQHDVKKRRVCFPGKSAEEAWRFTVIMRILELMHEALRKNITLSKRDIYYRDPALFGKQYYVDRYVDDIAYTLGVSRASLNVTAVAKGLVAGAVDFCRRDGSTINAASTREGMLVPNLKELLSADLHAVQWILIIEKEATFHSIAASNFWSVISTRGVIMTGKGYPDIATRALLRFLSTPSPQNGFASPPVYGLADFDPDGVAILSTYKHGSQALAHESHELRVPGLQWLGLRSEHVMLAGEHGSQCSQGLLTLSSRDRKKARSMLEHCEDEQTADYRAELHRMLILNVKAELQLLDAVPNGMSDLLKPSLGS